MMGWLVILSLACVLHSTESAKKIIRPRAELKSELRELFNGSGALSDFVFFELEDLETYNKVKGPPKKRTELRRPKKPSPRSRDLEEKVLAKALRDYGNGKNKDIISKFLLIMDALLYNEFTDEKVKGLINKGMEKIYKKVKKQLRKTECSTQSTTTATTSSSGLSSGSGKTSKIIATKSSTATKSVRKVSEIMTTTQNPKDELREIEKILKNVEDEIERKDIDDMLWSRKRRDVNEDAIRRLPRSPVQTIDHERMRRSASFTYHGEATCKEEGSEGTTSDTVMLCKTCYKTIDFGSSVVPQYANSIECDDSASKCLAGDGTCTQKVVYYTFQKLTDVATNTWTAFEQPLNVTCECECIADSITHTYMVGESNKITST